MDIIAILPFYFLRRTKNKNVSQETKNSNLFILQKKYSIHPQMPYYTKTMLTQMDRN